MSQLALNAQNFYSTSLTSLIPALSVDGSFTVTSPPSGTRGWIVANPGDSAKREIIYFYNRVGSTLYYRGVDRSSPKEHSVLDAIQMNNVAEYFNYFDKKVGRNFNNELIGGLDIKIFAGTVYIEGADVSSTDATLTMVDDTTNYIYYRFTDNTIQQTTVLLTAQAGYIIYTVVTAGGVITSVTRNNAWAVPIKGLSADFFQKNAISGFWEIKDSSVTNTQISNTIISGQSAVTTLETTDYFLFGDNSDSDNLKKVTLANLIGSLTTSNLAEGTNLYYTAARFNSAFAAKTTSDLTEGTNLYYTATRFNSAFAAKTQGDLADGITYKRYNPASVSITGGAISGITDLAIADGGTGASTATAALNNLLPSQVGNSGKFLTTNGTNTSWALGGAGSSTLAGLTDTTIASPISGQVIINDGAGSWNNKSLSGAITMSLEGVTGFNSTEETSIADDDLVLIYDTSETAYRKMSRSNFLSGSGGGGANEKILNFLSSLTAGDIAGIINDGGTLKVASFDDMTEYSFGSEQYFNSVITNYISVVQIDTDKYVICYAENSTYGRSIVATVSGTVITFGDPVTFNSANSLYIQAISIDTDKFVVCYSDYGNSMYGTSIVATVSGTVPTFGTAVVFESAAANDPNVVKLDTDKYAITYRDSSWNYGYTRIATVSGTVSSFGVKQWFAAAPLYVSMAQLDTDKYVICYRRTSDADGCSVVATVSGTVATFGSEQEFNGGVLGTLYISAAQLDTDKFVVGYRNGSLSGNVRIATVSGTVVTFGDVQEFSSTTTANIKISKITDNKYVICYANNSNQGRAIIAGVDGTVSSFGTAQLFHSPTVDYVSVAPLGDGKYVIAYKGTSNYGQSIVEEGNVVDNNPVIVKTTTAAGVDGTVVLQGGIATAPSGSIAAADIGKLVYQDADNLVSLVSGNIIGRVTGIDEFYYCGESLYNYYYWS